MGKYYLLNRNAPLGFEEVTEEEYLSVVGLPPVKDYAFKVYRGKMSIEDVPEDELGADLGFDTDYDNEEDM